MMKLDVKCALLYGFMRQRVYIELSEQDPTSKDWQLMGRLVKAMYSTRDAPQIWSEEGKRELNKSGFMPSALHPPALIKTSYRLNLGLLMSVASCESARGMRRSPCARP